MSAGVHELLPTGPARSPIRVVLAHGAGAAMDTPFMNTIAEGVAAAGIGVVRFEFDYMAKRRRDGKRRGPDRSPKLLATSASSDSLPSPETSTLNTSPALT